MADEKGARAFMASTQRDEPVFLGTAPATREDYRLALFVTGLLVAAFGVTAPWATVPLRAVPAYAPIYNSAVIVLDLITALLLYTQFRQLRKRSLLVLACGYIFTPPVIAAHALSFPDAYVAGGLFGGAQTTAWLWMGWHTLFPFFVAAYAVVVRREVRAEARPAGRAVGPLAVCFTLALAAVVVLLTTAGEGLLPELMLGSAYRSGHTRLILMTGWLAHVLALVALAWQTRLRRLIDLWVGVTLVALVINLALSAVLVNGRYELGFYLGRAYGLLGAVFVLTVLLREAGALYGKAVRAAAEHTRAEAALRRSEEKYRTGLEREVSERTTELNASRDLLKATMDSSMDMIQVFEAVRDEEGEIVDFSWILNNYASEKVYGDVIGQSLLTRNPGVVEEGIFDALRRVVETGLPDQSERHYVHEEFDGWFYQSTVKLGDGVATTTVDITERKKAEQEILRLKDEIARRAEEALRESEERRQSIANLVSDLLWESEADGSTSWYNQRWMEYTGQTFEQAAGWGWADAVHPADREAAASRYGEAVRWGLPLRQEYRIRRRDDEYRWFVVNAFPLNDDDGRVVKMYGAATDIHDYRTAAEALRRSEEQLRRSNEELERRVRERTRELEEIAGDLLSEVGERAAAEARVKKLLGQLVSAQEEERRRVARELHDTLGQQLAALRLSIDLLKTKAGGDGLREETERVQSIFDRLNADVDFLAWEMRPAALDALGLDAALQSFVRDWSDHFRISADYQGLHAGARRLAPEVETNLYRILQEALQNVHKHAGATRVSVLLEQRDGQAVLIVEDDGRGYDADGADGERGMGVTNMRERAALVGGTFEIESRPGAGTTVFVRVPAGRAGVTESD